MSLFEVKAEIAAPAAEAVAEALLEGALDHWSVLEDAIAKRAWVVGILDDARAASEAWGVIEGLLRERGTSFDSPVPGMTRMSSRSPQPVPLRCVWLKPMMEVSEM